MTFVFATFAGILGAAAGWIAFAFAAYLIGDLAGMGDFEGGRAMFAFFGIGPVGGLIGLILGMLLVLRYRGNITGFAPLAGRSVLVAGAAGLIAAGAIFLALNTTSNLSRPYPRVVFEIRLPPDAKIPDQKSVRITLDTDKNQTDALLDQKWLVQEEGRPVLRGFVELYMRTTNRLLVLKIAGEPDRIFQIRLWGNPGPTEFSSWEQVEFIGEQDGVLRRAADEDRFEFRYRVERES